MSKRTESWHSPRLERTVNVARWGDVGQPVLLFPTAGGDAEEVERFHVVDACAELIAAGRMKLYSCDSVNGRAIFTKEGDSLHLSWVLRQFAEFVRHELVPAIRADCHDDAIEVVTAGSSIGAYNALTALCRYPDVFRTAICMSGTYQLQRFLEGPTDDNYFWASPVDFVGLLDGEHLERLRTRSVVLACGGGANEDIGESWNVANVLGAAGIPNRVDDWGPEWPHDWQTWRAMLPHYLSQIC